MPQTLETPSGLETPDSKSARKASLFPFYHQIGKGERLMQGEMSQFEKDYHDEDWEDCKYMISYRTNSGWDKKAKRGMKVYNVLQTMTPKDEVSRIFLGYARTSIDQGINQMTEGEPAFDFEPFGPSDAMKVIVWKHLIKKVLSESQYKLQQETFFRDYFVMGCGVFEVFIDYPQRTIRVPNEAFPGGYEPIVVQDHRRPKVGVRAVNPMNCWRNPNIDSPNHVPSCLRRRIVTWNQMAQEFGRCMNPDGTPMYKNMDKLAKGSHACIYYYQDEIRDVYRIYIKTFGTESDGTASYPEMDGLGICVLDKPLKIHERVVNKIVLRSTGLNIPGMCSLRWGILFDKYDKNYEGNHSVYGMGLPERIEGEDTAIQGMFNQNLDNFRWANTVALNYQGADAGSYLDVDANRLYGAELIDGTITPMPLGIARIGDYQAMTEVIDKSTIAGTGINHNQMVGDTSKTLGEFALRIRQANRGAEQRLVRLETEVFKPVGSLLLANSLTVLTDDEYETMTEEDVSTAKESIKTGKRPANDYKDLNGKKPERRHLRYLALKGEKVREDFTVTKKRQLDYNAGFDEKGNSKNTLIPDPKMQVETSYIPLVSEYVYPAEFIESGLLPDCIVDSKRMLADIKNQEAKNVQTTINFILQLMQMGYKNADMDKMVAEMLEFAEIDPKRILTTNTNSSEMVSKVKEALAMMEQNQAPTPPPNALAQQVPGQVNAGAAMAQPGGLSPSADNAQELATGAL
jgi:hypothetical protein